MLKLVVHEGLHVLGQGIGLILQPGFLFKHCYRVLLQGLVLPVQT